MEDILIENFYEDFKNAQTPEEKEKLLGELIDTGIEISDGDLKELKLQIDDVRQLDAIENDAVISIEIEDGLYKLYSCIESISINDSSYSSGLTYYVKVDDPREFYKLTGIGETNAIIQNMINDIKPIYYIVIDDGIGTLKRKNIFPKDIEFSKYFTKLA